jgi:hypothetical protein
VEEDGLAVAREPHVGLDAVDAGLDGAREGRERVLGYVAVEAAVGKDEQTLGGPAYGEIR